MQGNTEMNNNLNITKQTYPYLPDYFADKTVAITGGTGFLGQAVVEKLLRCCPRVKKIFLLIREKKNISPSQRLKDLKKSSAFTVLRELQPNFGDKLSFLPCQLDAKGLGLSEGSKKVLLKEVNVFIHSAASLNFQEHLRLAYQLNTKCVRRLMKLAKKMHNLHSFVHISTAYVHCNQTSTTEEFHDTGIDYLDLESSLKWMDDTTCTKVTTDVIKNRPNTYTFTKALAEDVIKRESGSIPICIVRPSMIIPALQEPLPGWGCNVYGPTAFIIAYQKGLIRSVIANKAVTADLVPVDFVVNGVLSAAMKTGCDYRVPRNAKLHAGSQSSSSGDSDIGTDIEGSVSFDENSERRFSSTNSTCSCTQSNDHAFGRSRSNQLFNGFEQNIPIYHINTGTTNPLFIKDLEIHAKQWSMEYPASPVRLPATRITTNRALHHFTRVVGRVIPAYVGDGICVLFNRRRRFVRMSTAISKGMNVMEFFFMQSFYFSNENTEKLRKCLQEKDRMMFSFDARGISWENYFKVYIIGIRKYILKEDTSDYNVQRKHLQRLALLDNCISGAMFFGACGLLVTSRVTRHMWQRLSNLF